MLRPKSLTSLFSPHWLEYDRPYDMLHRPIIASRLKDLPQMMLVRALEESKIVIGRLRTLEPTRVANGRIGSLVQPPVALGMAFARQIRQMEAESRLLHHPPFCSLVAWSIRS